MSWLPPSIALAYMDQIQRGQAVVGDVELRKALKKAHSQLFSGAIRCGDQILELADDISAYDTRSGSKEVLRYSSRR